MCDPTFSQRLGWGVDPASPLQTSQSLYGTDVAGQMTAWWLQCNKTKRRKQQQCKDWVKCSEMEEGHALDPRAASLLVPKPFSLTNPEFLPHKYLLNLPKLPGDLLEVEFMLPSAAPGAQHDAYPVVSQCYPLLIRLEAKLLILVGGSAICGASCHPRWMVTLQAELPGLAACWEGTVLSLGLVHIPPG